MGGGVSHISNAPNITTLRCDSSEGNQLMDLLAAFEGRRDVINVQDLAVRTLRILDTVISSELFRNSPDNIPPSLPAVRAIATSSNSLPESIR